MALTESSSAPEAVCPFTLSGCVSLPGQLAAQGLASNAHGCINTPVKYCPAQAYSHTRAAYVLHLADSYPSLRRGKTRAVAADVAGLKAADAENAMLDTVLPTPFPSSPSAQFRSLPSPTTPPVLSLIASSTTVTPHPSCTCSLPSSPHVEGRREEDFTCKGSGTSASSWHPAGKTTGCLPPQCCCGTHSAFSLCLASLHPSSLKGLEEA